MSTGGGGEEREQAEGERKKTKKKKQSMVGMSQVDSSLIDTVCCASAGRYSKVH